LLSFLKIDLIRKLEDKSQKLSSEDNKLIIGNDKIPFKILPILWGDIKLFLKHKNTIKKMDNKYANVTELISLFVQINEKEDFFYNFTTVSNIIERIIEDDNK